MGKIKAVSVPAVVLAFSMVLTGCGSLKTARVTAMMGNALKKKPVTAARAVLSGEMTAGKEPVTSGLRLDIRTALGDGRAYSRILADLRASDREYSQAMELYSQPGQEKRERYLHLEGSGLWLRSELQKKIPSFDRSLVILLAERAARTAALRKTARGNDLLSLGIRAQDLLKLLESGKISLPAQLKDLDYSKVTFSVDLLINGKTHLPEKVQLKVKGLTPEIAGGISSLAGKELREIRPGDVTLTLSELRYEPQEVPQLPREAPEKAVPLTRLRDLLRELLQH